jgi:2-dehydropantoate 2-reductase
VKILVFGAGAVGLTVGGFLSRDHEVTLLGRPRYLKPIRQKGLTVSGIWGRHHFSRFSLATNFAQVKKLKTRFDLVLITVKAYDTERAAREIKKIAGPKTLLLSLQNGLGNIETLHRYFSKKCVLAGRIIFGVEMPAPAHVKVTVMAEPSAIGETFKTGMSPRVSKIAALFNEAGIPSAACPDVKALLWAKVIYNCALNPLASLLGSHYGFLMEKELTRMLMDEAVGEIYAVAKKARVHLKPETAEKYLALFYSKLVPRTYNHHPSMLQDLRNGKKTEIEALNGAIARIGKKNSVPAPVNAMLAEMIRQKERES